MMRLQTLQHLQRVSFKDFLPLGGDHAIAVLLGVARIGPLPDGRRVVDVAVRVTGHEGVRVACGSLDVQTNLNGQFSRERHKFEVSDAQRTHLHVEGARLGGVDFRLVHLEQCQVCIQPRQLFHDLDVLQIGLDLGAILGIETHQVVAIELPVVQVSLRVGRRKLGVQSLLDEKRKECFEVDIRALQGSHEPGTSGFARDFVTSPYGRWIMLMAAGWSVLLVTGALSGYWYKAILTKKLPYSAGLRDLEEKRAAQEHVTLWQDRFYYLNVVAASLAALGGAMAKF